ncbi:MAG: DNA mismatch repair protein MutS [Brevinema sp.]
MTPLEEQYLSIKTNHQDKILLFRLGDFYEIFETDAEKAAPILNIALTQRHGKPMCGFPHHAFEQHAYKLVEYGYKIAICEQMEDPSTAKGIVRREVVSVLTKGTWAENPLLDRNINTFICSFFYDSGWISLIMVDLGTGEVIIRSHDQNPIEFLRDELARYLPVEALAPESFFAEFPILDEIKSRQPALRLLESSAYGDNRLLDEYLSKYHISVSPTEKMALRGLFTYLQENHIPDLQISRLLPPRETRHSDALQLSGNTLAHLELLYNAMDLTPKGSLFSVINRTKTAGGSRLLRRLLASPSCNLAEVQAMQKRTHYFLNLEENSVLDILKGMGDLERLCARLAAGRILPRECLSLADSIVRAQKLKAFLGASEAFLPYIALVQPCDDIINEIEKTINPETSNQFDGAVIRKGVSSELDSLKDTAENGKNILISLQAEERLNTGISTLKIAYNKIYGYYIEVGKGSLTKVPSHYIRKQSLVNSERFTIPALDNFEKTVLGAERAAMGLEREIYEALIGRLAEAQSRLIPLAAFVCEVDVRFGLAKYAKENRCVMPIVTDNFAWNITGGRHPVVESLLKKEQFVANDTLMNGKQRIIILTGPNMAGKSTYLRQNALFAIMAQIGAPISAKSAEIGIVDQIFTRIGAGDDLSSGRSTFYMEMEEAAHILSQTTPKSLIIMDELGRGTSTSDGLSIAWAVIEFLLFHPDKKAKVLFSTHYHELTSLGRFDGISNFCMAVKENRGKPVFLRKVVEGKAEKSYGIHVAEMAGIDQGVVKRAASILNDIEKGVFFKPQRVQEEAMPLFPSATDPESPRKDEIYQRLKEINPESLTPLDALRILFDLKDVQK